MTNIPVQSKGDVAHAIAKAGLSAIPVLGGLAAELFQQTVQPPLEKRRTEWMKTVGEKLQQLEAQGLNLEDLQANENFLSVVMHATQAAMRTHDLAKREALRNAIANVAVGQAPDETTQYLLLSFINDLTEMHARILKLFHRPDVPNGIGMAGLSTVLESVIPELRGRRGLYDQLWRDLYSRGLVNTESLHVTMSASGLAAQRTTELGATLLKFISEHPHPLIATPGTQT